MSEEAGPAQPAPPTERIAVLDVLRGLALFGVLIAHFTSAMPTPHGVAERGTTWFIEVFVDGSFYPLLAMLFGMGFVLQSVRWEARGAPAIRLYLRRVVGLFLFGFALWCLVTTWWILLQYAVAALAMLPFRLARTRTLLLLAAAAFLMTNFVMPKVPIANGPFAPREEMRANQERLGRLEREGPYPELVVQRARSITMFLSHPRWYLRLGPQPLYLLLLGAAIARSRIVEHPLLYHSQLRRVVVWCALSGIIVNGLSLWRSEAGLKVSDSVGMILGAGLSLGDAALAFAYGATVILLFVGTSRLRNVLAPMAFVGRTALSNIWLQFIIRILLLGSGISLRNQIPGWAYLPFIVVVFAAEIWVSRWWLVGHRFGPLEWLWRTMTYGHPPRSSAAEPAI